MAQKIPLNNWNGVAVGKVDISSRKMVQIEKKLKMFTEATNGFYTLSGEITHTENTQEMTHHMLSCFILRASVTVREKDFLPSLAYNFIVNMKLLSI